VHDPDAPLVDGFTHWVAYSIPGDDDLDLKPALDRRALFERIEDHVVEQAMLVGTTRTGAHGARGHPEDPPLDDVPRADSPAGSARG
jgi:hypothetical protein